RQGLLIHPTVMGRRDWFRAHPYDPAYIRAEDHELWVRTRATTKFARLTEPLFFYRESLAGNLRNYLRSESTVRQIVRFYGPGLVGSWRTRLLLTRSRLKSLSYYLASKLGWQSSLIRTRNRSLDAVEIEAVRQALAAVRNTSVPGLIDNRAPSHLPEEAL